MGGYVENVTKQAVEDLEATANRAIDSLDYQAGKVIADLKARAEALAEVDRGSNRLFSGARDHFYATEIAAGGEIGASDGGIPLSGARIFFCNGLEWFIGAGPHVNEGPQLEPGRRYRMVVAFHELPTCGWEGCGQEMNHHGDHDNGEKYISPGVELIKCCRCGRRKLKEELVNGLCSRCAPSEDLPGEALVEMKLPVGILEVLVESVHLHSETRARFQRALNNYREKERLCKNPHHPPECDGTRDRCACTLPGCVICKEQAEQLKAKNCTVIVFMDGQSLGRCSCVAGHDGPHLPEHFEYKRKAKNCSNPLHPPDCLACCTVCGVEDCKGAIAKHMNSPAGEETRQALDEALDREPIIVEDCRWEGCPRKVTRELLFCKQHVETCIRKKTINCVVRGCEARDLESRGQFICEEHREEDRTYTKCKACGAQIYIGNCCGEACTKVWMEEITQFVREEGGGKRHCYKCGAAHEMKSNFCGDCS